MSRSRHPDHSGTSQVRIIGGKWRSRRIAFPDLPGLRPTGDRVRETLFNWLAPVLPGARCLDLFAGSGALGLEALSRGAAHCHFVESHPAAVQQLRANCQRLDATGACAIERADAAQWCRSAPPGQYTVVFLDPPFGDASLVPVQLLAELDRHGSLAQLAWAYIEQPVSAASPVIPGWLLHRELRAGQVRSALWQRAG